MKKNDDDDDDILPTALEFPSDPPCKSGEVDISNVPTYPTGNNPVN